MIEISLPIRLQSPNVKEHWTKVYKRESRLAIAVGFSLRTNKDLCRISQKEGVATLGWFNPENSIQGLKITFVRIGQKEMDFDNMVYSFKKIRDTTCAFFFPKLKPGHADSKKVFDIHYLQEKGPVGIKILLEFIHKK